MIVTAGAVFISLALLIAFFSGAAGLERFIAISVLGINELWLGLCVIVREVWMALPVRMDPWHLAVFYSALLTWACHRNWSETKEICRAIFQVMSVAAAAVWKVASDPGCLLFYMFFAFTGTGMIRWY